MAAQWPCPLARVSVTHAVTFHTGQGHCLEPPEGWPIATGPGRPGRLPGTTAAASDRPDAGPVGANSPQKPCASRRIGTAVGVFEAVPVFGLERASIDAVIEAVAIVVQLGTTIVVLELVAILRLMR
jgi:hypothetical protein